MSGSSILHKTMKVLIVGAGPTGSVVAESLTKLKTWKVTDSISVWEKSKGCGGRMATYRFSSPNQSQVSVDTGGQYISSTPFYQNEHASIYKRLLASSVLAPFNNETIIGELPQENGSRHFMCPDGINSIAKHFIKSSGAELKTETRVSGIEKVQDSVLVSTDNGNQESFDCVVLTIPTPQVLQLKGIERLLSATQMSILSAVKFSSRFAISIKLPDNFEPPVTWTAVYVNENPCVKFVSLDTKKRGKDKPHTLLVHTSVPFGLENLDRDPVDVAPEILSQTRTVLPWLPRDDQLVIKSSKWRYSQVRQAVPGQPGYMTISEKPRIVLCGDSFTHSNLDGCVASALKTVDSLKDLFTE